MAQKPPKRPNPPRSPQGNDGERTPKPYALVPFPNREPSLKHPAGHDKYKPKHWHGVLSLKLTVQTSVHVSTGIVATGTDIGNNKIPLVKTMATVGNKLLIPGSSLKGVVRSIYEAITNSTLAVVSPKYKRKVPKERQPCSKQEKLCPASRVFGALNWQGLVEFSDAVLQDEKPTLGFMPPLYSPSPDQYKGYYQNQNKNGLAIGRKFYYNFNRSIDAGSLKQGVPVQQAGNQFVFRTKVYFKNLTEAELGTLFISLGKDSQYPFVLKVGGGKPIGKGTTFLEITALERAENPRDRYLKYEDEPSLLTGNDLDKFIEQKTKVVRQGNLVELPQLKQLAEILQWPTQNEPPEGSY